MGLVEYACNRRSRQPQIQLMQSELLEQYFQFYQELLQQDTQEALVNAAGIDRRVAGKVPLNEKQIARVNQIYQDLGEDVDPDVVEMLATFVEYIRHAPTAKMAETSPAKQILEGMCQSRLNGRSAAQTLGCLLEMLRRGDVQTFSIVADQIM